jgi:hypothetical protein
MTRNALLAVLGIIGCLGMSLDLIVMMFCALFFNHQLTLQFNKYYEHIPELMLCSLFFVLGIFTLLYLLRS